MIFPVSNSAISDPSGRCRRQLARFPSGHLFELWCRRLPQSAATVISTIPVAVAGWWPSAHLFEILFRAASLFRHLFKILFRAASLFRHLFKILFDGCRLL